MDFLNDSTEIHYVAFAINNIDLVTARKAQSLLSQISKAAYPSDNYDISFSAIDNGSFLLWAGPFDDKKGALKYLGLMNPKLKPQFLALMPKQQYEIYIFGKSNISLVSTPSALTSYKEFMFKKIYKP
jgi:hypothetical protein